MTFSELARLKTTLNNAIGAYTEISAGMADRVKTASFSYSWQKAEEQLRKNMEELLDLGFSSSFIDELMDVMYHEGGTMHPEE